MTDDFFDDEQELMEASLVAASEDADVAEASASSSTTGVSESPAGKAGASPRRSGPPFWMVLVITAISLVLGVVIGYMLGTSAALAELNDEGRQREQQMMAAEPASELPEGHPQLSIDEQGNATVADQPSSQQ